MKPFGLRHFLLLFDEYEFDDEDSPFFSLSQAEALLGNTEVSGCLLRFLADETLRIRGIDNKAQVIMALSCLAILWVGNPFLMMPLIISFLLSAKVVSIDGYRVVQPDINRLLLSEGDFSGEQALITYDSYVESVKVTNKKSAYLQGAQVWMKYSVGLIVLSELVYTLNPIGFFVQP